MSHKHDEILESLIAEGSPAKAFYEYARIDRAGHKLSSKTKKNITEYLKSNQQIVVSDFLHQFPNLANENPRKAYRYLCLLMTIFPETKLGIDVRKAIVENQEEMTDVYLKDNNLDDPILVNEADPLVIALRWHIGLDLKKGHLNYSKSNLIKILSAERNYTKLDEVLKHMASCSVLDIKSVDRTLYDLYEITQDFYDQEALPPEEETHQFENQLREILIQTTPYQRFTEENKDLLESIKNERTEVVKMYFRNKTSPYSMRDFVMLSEPGILNKLEAADEVLQRAINDVSASNPKYYQDKSTWIAIVKSKNPVEIEKLQSYVKTTDASGIRHLAMQYHKLIYHGKPTKAERKAYRKQRNRLLRKAAVRGDKYARNKLNSFSKYTPEKVMAVQKATKIVQDIDDTVAILTHILNSRKYNRLRSLGIGNKEQLEARIAFMNSTKENVIKETDKWIDHENDLTATEFIANIESLSAPILDKLAKEIKNREIVKTAGIVAASGIPKLFDFVQRTASNYVSGTAPKKGSNFRFWNDHYYAAVDAMVDIPETASRLKKKQKAEKLVAKEQLDKAQQEVEKYEELIQTNPKNFLQKAFGIKSANEKALKKAEEQVAIAEKNVYRAKRNASDLSDVTWLSDNFPGLEIEERTVVTEDGKYIDILVVNNVAAQQRAGGPVADVIHFSGNECFYQMDDRHFEHAVSKGCNIIVVHDRLKSVNSRTDLARRGDFAKDGVAAFNHVVNMRKEEAIARGRSSDNLPEPIIHGYCGGGSIALDTYDEIAKTNPKVKFIADRTYRSTSAALVSVYSDPEPDDTNFTKFKKYLVKKIASPILRAIGWESDNIFRLKKIPEDQLLYYDVSAPENVPEGEGPYYNDYVIGKAANIHSGLEKRRIKQIEKIDKMINRVNDFRDLFETLDKISNSDRTRVLQSLEGFLESLKYLKFSLENTQLKSTDDEAHIAATSNFLLRDNTQLDDTIQSFIHDQREMVKDYFSPLKIDLNDGKQEKIIFDFWKSCGKFYNEFYNHGKKMSELHAADYDFRYRVNEVINAVNSYGGDFKVAGESQKRKMNLGFKPEREFYSPPAVVYDAKVEIKQVASEKSKESSKRTKPEKK